MEKEVLVFAGTTEGRRLSAVLSAAGVRHTVCVATAYGEMSLEENPFVTLHQGRMEQEEMQALLRAGNFCAVVDATHPYAQTVTRQIRAAVGALSEAGLAVPYLRLKREQACGPESGRAEKGQVAWYRTVQDCAEALKHTEGNILLTTGSKELPAFCASEGLKSRLYVRILPAMESLSLCMGQGILGKRIIAMQGPFSTEMNEAVLRQYGISCLVTKECGAAGGYPEKLAAAKRAGVQVFVVGRPQEEEGDTFAGVCRALEKICGRRIGRPGRMEITLAGAGMGEEGCLTVEAKKAVAEADLLLGAERLLGGISSNAEKYAFYKADQVLACLRGAQERILPGEMLRAAVLFSGDSGFYSGAQSVYRVLEQEIREGRLEAVLRLLPGISSVAYLAACLGESYQDAAVFSMHGKSLRNLARRIGHSPKTFLLTSGVRDVNRLGKLLLEAGMGTCRIITGYQLSGREERIASHTPEQCLALEEEGLYTCLILNPYFTLRKLTHGMADGVFARGAVPMTKEEVREAAIGKLRLRDKAVVYDIGSGTGSVAVEMAALSDDIQVFAVERKAEAVSLIRKNREKFRLENMTVVEGAAPEKLAGLPMATHAFIGGSGGRLEDILEVLWQGNPQMRVVMTAVSVETLCEMRKVMSTYRLEETELVQMQVSRAEKVGDYHLMRAENPVWICAFTFGGAGNRPCGGKEGPDGRQWEKGDDRRP